MVDHIEQTIRTIVRGKPERLFHKHSFENILELRKQIFIRKFKPLLTLESYLHIFQKVLTPSEKLEILQLTRAKVKQLEKLFKLNQKKPNGISMF